jgi:hypothetical protein
MGAIQDILDKFGSETVNIIADNMRANDQVATGETLESLKYDATDSRLLVTGAPYIMALETGRRPRTSSQEGGLASKLERWIVAKSIPIRRTLEQDAKSLAWFINKYGTKLFREGGRKDVITPAVSQDRVNGLVKQLNVVFVGETVKSIKTVVDGNNNK